MQLKPIEVPGYLIPYLIKECQGVTLHRQEENFYEIYIEPRSVIGMFLTRNIRPSYKVKNYNMVIYCKRMYGGIAFSTEILEFHNSAQFRIDLSFEALENFYKFLDTIFHASMFFYIKGFRSKNTERGDYKEAIQCFCEEYNLLEYGFNENQIRLMYHRYVKGGSLSVFTNNKSFNLQNFFGE